MSDFIKINGGEHVHLSMVKRLSKVTEEERVSLAKLGEHVDAERFKTRVDYSSGGKSYAPDSIDQIAKGVSLVEINTDTFVPRDNIVQAKNLSDEDRSDFKKRTGRDMPGEFQSQLRTRAGMVLSTADAPAIMQRMGNPYRPAPDEKPAKTLSQSRDEVMSKSSSPAKGKAQPQPHPDQ